MMGELQAKDCIDPCCRRVTAEQRYHDLRGILSSRIKVFAVHAETGAFLGLVTDRQAMLFPGRIFADLIVRRQARPLQLADDPMPGLERMRQHEQEYLPVMDGGGAYLGVISALSVLTTLSRREEAHRQARESLIEQLQGELVNRRIVANILEAASDGILVIDSALKVVLVNRAFSSITGYTAAFAQERRADFLRSSRNKPRLFRTIRDALVGDGNWEGEVWLSCADRSICPAWVSVGAVADGQNTPAHYVVMFSDIDRRESLRAQLLRLAYYDTLTGLPNRLLFQERLDHAIAQSRQTGIGFSLLFIDLDRFKDVNDALGHTFGDRLLCAVSDRFKTLVREVDTVARLGGDEFTFILLEMVEPEQLSAIAQRIFAALSTPVVLDGQKIYVSASIGVSRYPADGATAEVLVMNADAAMYRAKEDGNGSCHFFSTTLHKRLSERLTVSNALHRALEQNEFSLAWQPQFTLSDRRLVGVEVLLRWRREGKELVAPSHFIPIAEETGLIGLIGDWVLHEACRKVARFEPLIDARDFRIAVNFSPLQLRWHNQRAVETVIREYGLDCSRFKIELTENALFLQQDGILDFVRQVNAAGIAISIDDFGTGYCNLSSLKYLPVHEVKIDRSLIKDISHSPADRQIVMAMIKLAHTLGLQVVAEGIENGEQLSLLQELGCDAGQGYLFSPPVPVEELVELLSSMAASS
ncbi:EAL domain-containing protein [Cupriavidus necator]|uniref:putative bifunctional diguanylate cyclase/phosphodiesterase n=1 Tax=Cupriavidus necator TaxID=106590 RepID=UPI0039C33DC9